MPFIFSTVKENKDTLPLTHNGYVHISILSAYIHVEGKQAVTLNGHNAFLHEVNKY